MPGAWSNKDERMYRHIKEGQKDRGTPDDRAEEIAGRTVNKHRREEGRTPNSKSQGTGNPRESLEKRTVQELHNIAREMNIHGRGHMRKAELIDAIRDQR